MGAKLKFLFSKMWEFLYPFIKIFLSDIGPILASAAMSAVVVASTISEDGEEKRKQAFSIIVNDLKNKGIELGLKVTTSMVNAAIEAAVQKLKSK